METNSYMPKVTQQGGKGCRPGPWWVHIWMQGPNPSVPHNGPSRLRPIGPLSYQRGNRLRGEVTGLGTDSRSVHSNPVLVRER